MSEQGSEYARGELEKAEGYILALDSVTPKDIKLYLGARIMSMTAIGKPQDVEKLVQYNEALRNLKNISEKWDTDRSPALYLFLTDIAEADQNKNPRKSAVAVRCTLALVDENPLIPDLSTPYYDRIRREAREAREAVRGSIIPRLTALYEAAYTGISYNEAKFEKFTNAMTSEEEMTELEYNFKVALNDLLGKYGI